MSAAHLQLVLDTEPDEIDPIEERCTEWCKENPHVYPLFERFALEAARTGRLHYSAKTIVERMRWHLDIETTGDAFKINNDFPAIFARWFHARHAGFDGFFRTRKRAGE